MNNFLSPYIPEKLREISVQSLAHVGDAVYELMVRTHLCLCGTWTGGKLHDKTVAFVSAKAQASACERLLPILTDEETDIFRRGRNAHTRSVSKSSNNDEYHAATGIETLFGHLYLSGNTTRLNELFMAVICENGETE